MPRADQRHWQVATAETWATIATTCQITRDELWRANGVTAFRALLVGELIHLPLVSVWV